MKILKTAVGAALLSLCFALPANAATFNFFWSADPAADPTITSSDDPTATAMGTLDINVANGAAFTAADLSDGLFVVVGDSFPNFSVAFVNLTIVGLIAPDGASAAITGNFIGSNPGGGAFACLNFECQPDPTIVINTPGPMSSATTYNSPAAALASFKLTAAQTAVPVPAALPLLGTGLALFGLMGWRRKHKSAA